MRNDFGMRTSSPPWSAEERFGTVDDDANPSIEDARSLLSRVIPAVCAGDPAASAFFTEDARGVGHTSVCAIAHRAHDVQAPSMASRRPVVMASQNAA